MSGSLNSWLPSWLGGASASPSGIYLPPTPTDATMAGNEQAAPSFDWNKASTLLSKFGGQIGGSGQGQSGVGPAGGTAGDAAYLKIGGEGAGPYNPGNAGLPNLLATLMQMSRASTSATLPQIQPRMSLLG